MAIFSKLISLITILNVRRPQHRLQNTKPLYQQISYREGFNQISMETVMHVLVMGNNPIELTRVFEKLKQLHGKQVVMEIAFDLKSCKERLSNFSPNYIFIDDNLGRQSLSQMVRFFAMRKSTKNIPITILKNSNYQESFSGRVMNYLLKENLTAEILYGAITNSIMALRAQVSMLNMYQKRKGQLKRLIA
jgi:hypothetical protein